MYGPKFFEQNPQPILLIFKEKHGNRYFVINSFQEQLNVAFKIVKERMNNNEYPSSDEAEQFIARVREEEGQVAEALTSLSKVKGAAIAQTSQDLQNRLIKLNRTIMEHQMYLGMLQKIEQDKEPTVNFVKFLYERRDFEYEGYTYEELESV